MDEGYIKLYRSSIKKGWLQNPKLWAFWCWCIMKASYQEHDMIVGHQIVNLSPGQFVFGLKNASKELKQSIQNIRTHINFCSEIEQNLTVQPTNKFSIITIVNWHRYQSLEIEINNQINNQLTNHSQTTNTLLTTNKKGNNGKKEKKQNILTSWPDEFVLTDHLRKLASQYIPEDKIELEWEAFKAYSISNAKKYANWEAGWKTRYLNYSKYNSFIKKESKEDESLKDCY